MNDKQIEKKLNDIKQKVLKEFKNEQKQEIERLSVSYELLIKKLKVEINYID